MTSRRAERIRRLAATRLYLILTPEVLGPGWLHAARDALASGVVGMVQLRCPGAEDAVVLQQAAALRPLCAGHRCLFVVNDRPDLARAAGADGVHVGRHDAPPDEARKVIGPDAILGLSTHDQAEVLGARVAGADYVGLGPCYPSWTKTDLVGTPQGPGLVARCAPLAGDLPLFPIGGINAENAASLVLAGARRLAVGAGVLAQDDPTRSALRLDALLGPRPEP